jgi:hypothetical protein
VEPAGGVFPCERRQSDRAPPARGRLGREGEMGWPRGRGPVGRGKKADGKEKKMGRGWAEWPDGPKATEKILCRIKI